MTALLESTGTVRQRGAQQRVLRYFTERPLRSITLDELVDHLSLARPTITGACARLVLMGEVSRIGSGIYRHDPNASAHVDEPLFAQVKILTDDRRLIEDEDGSLWVAKRVEV